MAQSGSAPQWGCGGPRFESGRPDRKSRIGICRSGALCLYGRISEERAGSHGEGLETAEVARDTAALDLERGVVTGSRKTMHPGKVVITFALGSAELYDYLDNNPLIEAHPSEYVNDPFIVSQNENMVAINSALDYTLVLLPTNVSGTYGYMQLREEGPVLDERIYIPGHPAIWGKRISVVSDQSADQGGAPAFCFQESFYWIHWLPSIGSRKDAEIAKSSFCLCSAVLASL